MMFMKLLFPSCSDRKVLIAIRGNGNTRHNLFRKPVFHKANDVDLTAWKSISFMMKLSSIYWSASVATFHRTPNTFPSSRDIDTIDLLTPFLLRQFRIDRLDASS